MSYAEYAIWGKPPSHEHEALLVAMPNGKPITDKLEAERIKALLENEHKCTACRIQTLDGSLPDFVKVVQS